MTITNRDIPSPFDPEEFRIEGHKLVDQLADYLAQATSGSNMPVLPWNEPDKLAEAFSFDSFGGENEPFERFIKRIIDNSIHIHHPRYIGHQVTAPLPLTALVQFCTTLLNNGAAIYEMGPVNMAMEKNVIQKFGSLIGYKKQFDGIFTHGGTAGNLTAMLAARQAKTNYNIWEEGIRENEKPGYMISEQAHYSVGRNVKIMGLGEDSIIKVPVDENFRMMTGMLESLREEAGKKGIRVIGVVGSSCSTGTGTYDDLNAIADFCEKYDLWMHVDGAHGMGVLFSEKYRNLVDGIQRADSVVIDFHKMFLVPALNTLVMFRTSDTSFQTFSQKASYLFNRAENNVWYNSAVRTIECTKSALGIIAYTALKYYGTDYLRTYIESRYDLTQEFAKMLRTEKNFQIAVQPESNIICFRYAPEGLENQQLNRLNANIRKNIIKEGSFYIVQTELNGTVWLRLTIINPVTGIDDLRFLLKVISEHSHKAS